jgi:hypothetical protein
MPLRKRDRRWAWVGAAGLAAALIAAAFFSWNRVRDRQVASDVETEVTRVLMALRADDPVILRHGQFLRLEGDRATRSFVGMRLWGSKAPPITLYRKAVFSKSWAPLTIHVHPGPALAVSPWEMVPEENQSRSYQSTIRDGQVWFTAGTNEHYSTLTVLVDHPRCPNN